MLRLTAICVLIGACFSELPEDEIMLIDQWAEVAMPPDKCPLLRDSEIKRKMEELFDETEETSCERAESYRCEHLYRLETLAAEVNQGPDGRGRTIVDNTSSTVVIEGQCLPDSEGVGSGEKAHKSYFVYIATPDPMQIAGNQVPKLAFYPRLADIHSPKSFVVYREKLGSSQLLPTLATLSALMAASHAFL